MFTNSAEPTLMQKVGSLRVHQPMAGWTGLRSLTMCMVPVAFGGLPFNLVHLILPTEIACGKMHQLVSR